ncbi:MAG: hypothetical protein PV347_06970 [Rickettsiaceae bacterium]|nr:hypothetical protein [Rickettsiaceae bacterium]MDD9337848.1 hypothetical protein [Rickettsiaceae bacterium]
MSSDIENQQQNNKQDKLTSDISFELEQAALKLINNLDKINLAHINLLNIALENALENNKTLTHINLRNSNIDDEGAKIVAKFLQNNNIVTKIDLSNNNISCEEVSHLVPK